MELKPEIALPDNTVVEDQVMADESDSPTDTTPEDKTPEDTEGPQSTLDAVKEGLKEESGEEPDVEPDPDPDDIAEPKEAAQSPDEDTAVREEPENEMFKIPDGLKKDATERFEKLVTSNKETTAQLEATQEDFGKLQQVLQDTGANFDQMANTFDYLTLRNSNDPAQIEQALDLIKQEARVLAKHLGKEEAGVDLLEGHTDLQDRVENSEIQREDAIELANSRNLTNRQNTIRQETQNAEIQDNNFVVARDQAALDLKSFFEGKNATDINFAEKNAVMVGHTEQIFSEYPPDQWLTQFERLYDNLGKGARMAQKNNKRTLNRDLKNSSTSNGDQAPQSMRDAINMGMESLR